MILMVLMWSMQEWFGQNPAWFCLRNDSIAWASRLHVIRVVILWRLLRSAIRNQFRHCEVSFFALELVFGGRRTVKHMFFWCRLVGFQCFRRQHYQVCSAGVFTSSLSTYLVALLRWLMTFFELTFVVVSFLFSLSYLVSIGLRKTLFFYLLWSKDYKTKHRLYLCNMNVKTLTAELNVLWT